MKCPQCGSENVVLLTDQQQQGFGFCKSILGYICLGPIGLICGLCGMGKTKSVRHSIHCQNCNSRSLI